MTTRQDVRRGTIRSIIRKKQVRTQRELTDDLVLRGFECSQATVARDMDEMGLRKDDHGAYVLPSDVDFMLLAREFVASAESAGNLAVVRVTKGNAFGVAVALEGAGLPGVLGVAVGPSAVLAACRSERAAEGVVAFVGRFVR